MRRVLLSIAPAVARSWLERDRARWRRRLQCVAWVSSPVLPLSICPDDDRMVERATLVVGQRGAPFLDRRTFRYQLQELGAIALVHVVDSTKFQSSSSQPIPLFMLAYELRLMDWMKATSPKATS